MTHLDKAGLGRAVTASSVRKADKRKTVKPTTNPSSRRWFLKSAAATAAVAATGPWIVRDAHSSSGDLRLMMGPGQLPRAVVQGFEKETGIKVRHFPYGGDGQLLNKILSVHGHGVDLISPAVSQAPQWRDTDVLQPFDMNRVAADRIENHLLAKSLDNWTWDKGTYHLPYLWGTEALAWRTEYWDGKDGPDLSYGDLWHPHLAGKVMGRPHSMMLGIGLYLDDQGILPSNRMLDAYKDEESMHRIWSRVLEFALQHRVWIRMFWDDAEAQKRGFLRNGVVAGQTWDGPTRKLKNEGEAVKFRIPREGGLARLDGLSVPAGAQNLEQVYAFIDYVYRPETGGLIASETGCDPVQIGAEDHMTEQARQDYQEIYGHLEPDDLWWWPSEPEWYAAARASYEDRFIAG